MADAAGDAIRWLQDAAPVIARAVETAHADDEKFASNFNLFRLLRIERNEVSTHSRFLRELLDPEGSHGQRGKPLSLFLRHCKRKGGAFADLPDFDDGQDWRVTAEEQCSEEGRTDILIESRRCETLIVIENKVGSGELEGQCLGYWNWMQMQTAFTRKVLIYLTPSGDAPPSLHSHPDTRFGALSYATEIKAWLDDLILDVTASPLREALKQYREIIAFEPLSPGVVRMRDLVDFIKQSENLKNAIHVHDAVDTARKELDEKLWEDLRGTLCLWSPQPELVPRSNSQCRWMEVWPEGAHSRELGTYLYPCVEISDSEINWGIAWSATGPALPEEVRDFQSHLKTEHHHLSFRKASLWLGHVSRPFRPHELHLRIAGGEDILTPITAALRSLLTDKVTRFVNASNQKWAKPGV
jgi:hypothetical protein